MDTLYRVRSVTPNRESATTTPAQLAFEVEALLVAGNHVYHLDNDPRALALARAGTARRLEDLRTPEAPALADDPQPAPTGP
jgi:hypothetical protein